jgi:hypothetical protein
MSAYDTTEKANAVFGELFHILIQDENFTTRLRESALDVRLIHTKPDCKVYVSPDEVLVGDDVPESAAITIKMSCDTAHKLWLGTLMMPTAIARADPAAGLRPLPAARARERRRGLTRGIRRGDTT